MGFDDGSCGELAFAREVAAAFRANHRERTVTPALEPLFDKLVVHLDEPFADVSMFPDLHGVVTRPRARREIALGRWR